MVRRMQPCDWQEHDVYPNGGGQPEYVVDAYGRTPEKETVRVRIVGFKPYFYARLPSDLDIEWNPGVKTTVESKYDIFAGFNGFKPVDILKVECPSMTLYRTTIKNLKESNRESKKEGLEEIVLYEANIPPFLRFFHERGIQPASPFVFQPIKEDPRAEKEGVTCQKCYIANYQDIACDSSASTIPLKVCSYDLEVYSESGAFPMASKPSDEIIQIGMTFRWSHDLMKVVSRKILVLGTIPDDPEMESCPDEVTLLSRFKEVIEKENPDVLCGYNTFGFDDKYVVDRAVMHKMKEFQLGRVRMNITQGKKLQEVILEHKKFELASGTYDVNFMRMPGRLSIDLLLNMRREHNLDSYKLDNVANTFLRDKVVDYKEGRITTKSTRGLRVGNFVRFDIVGNTTDPYADGEKFVVTSVDAKGFTLDAPHSLFEDLNPKDRKSLEWTFTKDDIHPHDIFRKQKGTPDDRADIARYCLQDCDLVVTLMAKLDTLVNARGMADVCFVPMQYLFLRGQGIKIYSRVAYEASKRNQIIVTQEALEGDISYEGAIVIPPKIGMYLDQPVSVLDYNSLYPSSMILENLSPDTFVCRKYYNSEGRLVPDLYEGVSQEQVDIWRREGYVFNEVRYTENDFVCVCTYVSPPKDQPLGIGIIPTALQIMLSKRKESRLQAEYKTVTTKTGETYSGLLSETATDVIIKKGKESVTIPKSTIVKTEDTYDDAQKSVFNGLQLAYKVVANSIYGQLGSRTSPIRKMCVAACTTAVGRRQLLYAKDFVEREYGAEVVYGDSIASYTPVLVKTQGVIQLLTVDSLEVYSSSGWVSDGEKEFCTLDGVFSWTETGWVPIRQLIRHTLVNTKKMVRILTHTGLVDVTEDHSLVRASGDAVSPKDVTLGTQLMHAHYPEIVDGHYEMSEDEARIAGFFFGDGSCGVYSGKKASWALNNANLDLLETYKELCEKVYPNLSWTILPTLVSSNVYKLVPISKVYGDLSTFIIAYRSTMYTKEKAKRIPLSVLNGSVEVRQAFWNGLYDADRDKDMNGYVRIDQKHQLSAAHIAFLGASLGYKISINTRTDKPNVYRVTCTKTYQRKDPFAIKKLHEIDYSGYVYDLTTDNHHFQAGIGQMIVHNTDSIFIKFQTKNLAESIELGQKAAEQITTSGSKNPDVMKIGYEKTFYPFILFCRKRYVGMMYEDDPNGKPKRKSMGIVLKRRDNAPIVKDVFGGALDLLLDRKTVPEAATYVQDLITRVLKHELPIEKFVITKQLRDDYKDPTKIAHRVLADRMKARDPGSAPNVGDRLQFIYVEQPSNHTGRKVLQGDRIEALDYVKANRLNPDAEFYITNQIQNPVAQLFALCIDQIPGYKEPRPSYKDLFVQGMSKHENNEEEATLWVLERKERQLESLLFMESPAVMKVLRTSRKGPLDTFFKGSSQSSQTQ
jgi:DNA polymerase elongation subunit (family B)